MQLTAVKQALGWEDARRMDIIQIRPPEDLHGDAFSSLFDKALREEYLAHGIIAAEEVLRARQWLA